MPDDRSDNYFADAHRHRRDITDSYLAFGDIPNLVGISLNDEEEMIKTIRRHLKGAESGIRKISDLAQPSRQQAESLYRNNQIAAIDGTDAVSPLRFISDTLYATGVVAVTPQEADTPRVRVTRTRASSQLREDYVGSSWTETLRRWGEYLQGARENEMSWVGTFREYEERTLANEWLKGGDDRIALIDGPVLTQNLLSQKLARDLLEEIVATGRAIGFIKNLSSNPILVAIGCALEPGEAFVIGQWRRLLSERFARGQQSIADWVEEKADRTVRAVYKHGRKAYCLECDREKVGLAFAILNHDSGASADHDIPMLLQVADARVRNRFKGVDGRNEVLARYTLQNPDRLIELTHERTLR